MTKWCFFAGGFLQFASHVCATTATGGKYSSSCSALLRDVNALQDALATMWELRDTPDAEYPPATSAVAICAWTALEPALKPVVQPVLDGRLLSPSFQEVRSHAENENASSVCNTSYDDREFVDEHGFSCTRWSFMDCYKELGYTVSQLKAVQQSCPFTCAGCARAASMARDEDTGDVWFAAFFVYLWFIAGLTGTAIFFMALHSCGIVPGQLKVKPPSIAMCSIALSSCGKQLKGMCTLLQFFIFAGSSSQCNFTQKIVMQYVVRTKAKFRRRYGMLVAIVIIGVSIGNWSFTARTTPCSFPTTMFYQRLEYAEPLLWLVQHGLYACPLLPPSILGQRGMTAVGFLILLCQIGRVSVYDRNDVWWYMNLTTVLAQIGWRVLPLLMYKTLFGCFFHLTYSAAMVIGWGMRFGYGRVFFHQGQEESPCHVWDVSRPWDTAVGQFSLTLEELVVKACLMEIISVTLLCSFDRVLQLGCLAMGRLAQMERQEKVFLSLMTLMSDCVVYLDSKLGIREPANGLTSLLLRGGPPPEEIEGLDFRSLLATAEDVDIVSNALLVRTGNSLSLLHVRMKDTMGARLNVQIYWRSAENIDGTKFFILGITEARTVPPANTLGNLYEWDEKLEMLRSGWPEQLRAATHSEESWDASHTSHSLGDRDIALTVALSWPMAIFESNCPDMHKDVYGFSEFFLGKKRAMAFQKLLEKRLEEVLRESDARTFPVFQKLGNLKLRLPAVGVRRSEVLVTLEVSGACDGSESSREEAQDAPQAPKVEWVILHLSSPRRARTVVVHQCGCSAKKENERNQEKEKLDSAADEEGERTQEEEKLDFGADEEWTQEEEQLDFGADNEEETTQEEAKLYCGAKEEL